MKLVYPLDASQLEIQNATFQLLASDIGSPVEGQFFYNSTAKKLKYYNGTAWLTPAISGSIANSDIASGAAIALSKLATDPLARANHTGTQGASTISDLATTVQAYRLDQFAAPNSSISLNSQKITGLAAPTTGTDAANKNYVDNAVQSVDPKDAVKVRTTANITLSGTQTIDGVALSVNDRVLVMNQNTGADNGIYTVAAGVWQRASDFDEDIDVNTGAFVFVQAGTLYANTGWRLQTSGTVQLGTTSLSFTQFSGAGSFTAGGGLTQTGTEFAANVDGVTIQVNGSNQLEVIGVVGAVNKYTTAVGNGSSTSFTINHALNTRDVIVAVRLTSSPYTQVIPDIVCTDANNVTLSFATAPSSNYYTVTVIG